MKKKKKNTTLADCWPVNGSLALFCHCSSSCADGCASSAKSAAARRRFIGQRLTTTGSTESGHIISKVRW